MSRAAIVVFLVMVASYALAEQAASDEPLLTDFVTVRDARTCWGWSSSNQPTPLAQSSHGLEGELILDAKVDFGDFLTLSDDFRDRSFRYLERGFNNESPFDSTDLLLPDIQGSQGHALEGSVIVFAAIGMSFGVLGLCFAANN